MKQLEKVQGLPRLNRFERVSRTVYLNVWKSFINSPIYWRGWKGFMNSPFKGSKFWTDLKICPTLLQGIVSSTPPHCQTLDTIVNYLIFLLYIYKFWISNGGWVAPWPSHTTLTFLISSGPSPTPNSILTPVLQP